MSNKAVSYAGPGKVEVIDIPYPTFELQDGPGVRTDSLLFTSSPGLLNANPWSIADSWVRLGPTSTLP